MPELTLKKAIETVESAKRVWGGLIPPEEQAAVALLIEAGKFVEGLRAGVPRECIRLLPGERRE